MPFAGWEAGDGGGGFQHLLRGLPVSCLFRGLPTPLAVESGSGIAGYKDFSLRAFPVLLSGNRLRTSHRDFSTSEAFIMVPYPVPDHAKLAHTCPQGQSFLAGKPQKRNRMRPDPNGFLLHALQAAPFTKSRRLACCGRQHPVGRPSV